MGKKLEVRDMYAEVVCDYCSKKNAKGKKLSVEGLVTQILCQQCWDLAKYLLTQLEVPITYPDWR